jgi:phage shock protein E
LFLTCVVGERVLSSSVKKSILLALICGLFVSGCGQPASKTAASGRIQRIDPTQVKVIDVRTPEEYREGYVQGTTNIPLDELATRVSAAVPNKEAAVAVHCRSGRRSAQAKELLEKQGYRNVQDLGSFENARAVVEGK